MTSQERACVKCDESRPLTV